MSDVVGQAAPANRRGLVIALVLVAVIGGCSIWISQSSSSSDGGAYVKIACRDWVKDRLKAPSSADFSSEVVTHDGNRYTVNGAVDSDNSFGASIRNRYECVADYSDDGSTLVSLSGLDQ